MRTFEKISNRLVGMVYMGALVAFIAPLLVFGATVFPAGTLLQTGDVSTVHILNGTIVNADISASAAISGSKVNPGGTAYTLLRTDGSGIISTTEAKIVESTNDTYFFGHRVHASSTNFNGVAYNWPGADGSSAQVLQTDGAGQLSWVDSGRTLLYATTTDVTVSNTAATTTLISFTVPGNTLSTGNVIRGRLNLNGGTYGFSLVGGVTMTVKVLYGGSEVAVAHLTPSGNFENLTVGNYGAIEFNIVGKGTTGTQEGYVDISAARYDTPTVLHSAGVGSAAVDSTADKTLSVVVKYSSAGVNNSINLTNAYVEIAR